MRKIKVECDDVVHAFSVVVGPTPPEVPAGPAGTVPRYHDPTRHTKRSSRAPRINAALAEARTSPRPGPLNATTARSRPEDWRA